MSNSPKADFDPFFEITEYKEPPIQIVDDEAYGPGKIGAYCYRPMMLTFDPRHPRCGGCGRFVGKGGCWLCDD